MAPQLTTGVARGAVVSALCALAAFGTLYGAGADRRQIVSGVIAAVVPVALGFMGYAYHDGRRAALVARGRLSALRKSDVGFDAAKRHIEQCVVADPPRAPRRFPPH